MSDGTRTRDRLDHNQELYQLSYAHQARPNLAAERSRGRLIASTVELAPVAPDGPGRDGTAANGLANRRDGCTVGVTIRQRTVDVLTTVVELEGSVDLYDAAEVNARLGHAIDEQCRRLVLDVRRVTGVDFSFVAIVAQTARALAQRHATLEVVCHDNEVGRLLATAGERARFRVTFTEARPRDAGRAG